MCHAAQGSRPQSPAALSSRPESADAGSHPRHRASAACGSSTATRSCFHRKARPGGSVPVRQAAAWPTGGAAVMTWPPGPRRPRSRWGGDRCAGRRSAVGREPRRPGHGRSWRWAQPRRPAPSVGRRAGGAEFGIGTLSPGALGQHRSTWLLDLGAGLPSFGADLGGGRYRVGAGLSAVQQTQHGKAAQQPHRVAPAIR